MDVSLSLSACVCALRRVRGALQSGGLFSGSVRGQKSESLRCSSKGGPVVPSLRVCAGCVRALTCCT